MRDFVVLFGTVVAFAGGASWSRSPCRRSKISNVPLQWTPTRRHKCLSSISPAVCIV